jgi:L-alanine-DL-glutamate epimerase-like enolase superfamily enzyme
MQITDVEAIVVRATAVDPTIADGSQDDLVVRVSTDEGIVGVGEVDSSPEVARAVIEAPASHSLACGLRELLLGADPLEVEECWERMYRGAVFLGRRGVAIHAMSGIDIALWDIKGQALGQPVSALVGTPVRTRVRAYASMLMPESPAEVQARVAEARDAGFTAVKLGWGPLGTDPARDVDLAAAACDAGGPETAIMIDAGFAYGDDAALATHVARELHGLGVYWLEEPLEPDALDAYAALTADSGLRIAAGEQEATRWSFGDLVRRGCVDVVQPDVTRCGGITELVRIAQLARDHGVVTVPHAWKSGIIKAASLHVNATLPGDGVFLEYCVADSPISRDLTHETFPLDADGYVDVPTGPGLGVTLDDEIVQRYRV